MDRRECSRPIASTTSRSRGKGHGFTIIEILVVLVVLGILAAIASAKFAGAKEKAFIAAMISDLHTAAIYEEMYAADNGGSYFSGTVTATSPVQNFRTSKDVSIVLTTAGQAWVGVASHAGTTRTCERRTDVVICN